MNQQTPDITVIILTFNSSNYIEKCLDSVLKSTKEAGLVSEIYVIDNGSKDGSIDILKRYKEIFPDIIKLKLFQVNRGTTISRNYGLSRAKGKYILILDSDAYINTTALVHLINVLNKEPSIGIVVPKILYPSGNFQKSTDVFPTLIHKIKRLFFLKTEERKSKEVVNHLVRDVDYAISAFWLLKKELLDKVGLLDEKIFYSPEDVDYCIRVKKAGYRIVYDPRVEIIHDAQELSRIKLNKFFFSHLKGLFYLFKKHQYGIIRKSPIKK